MVLPLPWVAAAVAAPGGVMSRIPAPCGCPDGLTRVEEHLWITDDSYYIMLYRAGSRGRAAADRATPPGGGSGSRAGLAWDGTCIRVTGYRETGAQIHRRDLGTQHLSPIAWGMVKTVFTG